MTAETSGESILLQEEIRKSDRDHLRAFWSTWVGRGRSSEAPTCFGHDATHFDWR
jgi:hypothetical protein